MVAQVRSAPGRGVAAPGGIAKLCTGSPLTRCAANSCPGEQGIPGVILSAVICWSYYGSVEQTANAVSMQVSMTATLTAFELPLRLDAQGTIRVGRSRVTLDVVIAAYQRGASPEMIARQFPAVALAEVYATIAYYLQHQPALDAYLGAREETAAPFVAELIARTNPVGTRARLHARLADTPHGD